jgi:hypothetical protein
MKSESVKQIKSTPKRKAPKTAWKPGQSGNPNGRPKAGKSFAERIRESLSEEDWTAIIEKATEQAKAGDKAARDFLLDRTEGKPNQKIDITEHDPDEVIVIG